MNALADRDFCAALVISLGHFLWQGALIAGLVALVSRRLKTANARCHVLVAAFCLMAISPFVTLAVRFLVSESSLPSTVAAVQSPAAKSHVAGIARLPAQSTGPLVPMDVPPGEDLAQLPAVAPIPTAPPITSSADKGWQRFAPLLMNVYLLGVAAMLLRLVVGVWGGWRLRHRSTPVEEVALLQALRRQAQSLGMKCVPVLAWCESVAVPTVIGILKPTILLPLSLASGLAADQVESVLAHELAHLRRYDHLVNLFQRVVESLLFFHPAVWWLSNRIRVEREHCCDDMVVACGAVPLDYAKSLLRVAELSRLSRRNRSVSAVSLLATGQPSTLRQRIARLLGDATDTHVRFLHRWPAILLATLCLFVAWTTTRVGWGLPTKPDEKQAPFVAELPGGVKVELLSIGYHQTLMKKWWAADGTVLPAEPRDPKLKRVEFSSFTGGSLQGEAREIAVRITGIPKQETFVGYQFCWEPYGDAVSNAVVYEPSEFTSASMPLVSQLKDKRVSLRICIDPLPEEIVRTISADGKKKLGGDPISEVLRRVDELVQPVRVEKVGDQTELLLKPVNRGAGPPIDETVPVAIDKVGGRHASIQAGGREGFFTYRYPVASSEIARFEYRLKPYRHWVTFSNLSIHPGEKTDVRVKVESLVVTDSKKTEAIDSTPPKSDPESQYQTATYLQEKISAKIPDAAWGKPNKGLRLAMVIRDESNTDWNELPTGTRVPASWTLRPGDQVHSQLVVENVSDKPINLTGYTYSEVDRSLEVFGREQKQLSINATHIDILPIPTSWKLLPGERYLLQMPPIAFLDEKSEHRGIGYYVRTPPGEYTVRCGYALGQRFKDDPRPAPDPAEWTGVLQAGDIKVVVDDPNDKVTSRIRRGQDALDRIEQFKPAWGEVRSGIQMGLARLGETDKFRPGQRIPLEFSLRNVGKQTAKVQFHVEFYSETPTVLDADGQKVKIAAVHLLGARVRFTETLKPGELVVHPHWGLGIGPDRPAGYSSIWHPFVEAPLAGTYTVSQDLDSRIEVEGSTQAGGGLTSGAVKFEIVVDPAKTVASNAPASAEVGAAPAKSSVATCTGTLVGPDGKPVPNIEIVAYEGQTLLGEKRTTNEQGQFTVPMNWAEADHSFIVVARDGAERLGWFDFFYNGHSDNGQQASKGSFQMVLLPLDRTVRGRLIDPAGDPLSKVPVQIEFLQHAVNFSSTSWHGRKLADAPLLQATTTNDRGEFELKVPADSGGTLRTSSVDWVEQRISFRRDQSVLGDINAVRAAKVAGQVIDSRTGKPRAGIGIGVQVIKLDLRHGGWGDATTDANGRYEIGGLPAGEYNILLLEGAEKTLTAAAHESATLESGETFRADFRLVAGQRLAGRVVDETTGQPIADCKVGYYGAARPPSGGAALSTTTNARGEFEFFVPPGKSGVYVADARETGLESSRDVDVPAVGELEPVVLKAGPQSSPTENIKVWVGAAAERLVTLKANRMPLEEALTKLSDQANVTLALDTIGLKTLGYTRNMPVSFDGRNVPLQEALTQILGRFEKLSFAVDESVLFVSSVDKVQERIESSKRQTGAISGVLLNGETGQPVMGAIILCQMVAGEDGKVPAAAETDRDGKYVLKDVPLGIYNVWVSRYDADPKLVAAADQGVEVQAGQTASSKLRLVTGRQVRGQIIHRGKPVAAELIGCYSAARPQSTANVQSTKSADDGTFEFLLPPGPAYLYTMSGGFTGKKRLYASVHLIIPAKEDIPTVTLEMSEKETRFGSTDWVAGTTKGSEVVKQTSSASVTGIVVDPDGKPIVRALLIKAEEWDKRIFTDERGEFDLQVDRGTQFVFAVHAPGFNVWTGTPTTGDVLKIVLEPKQR